MQQTKICKSCGKPLTYKELRKGYYYHEKCFAKDITLITKNGKVVYTKFKK